MARNQGVNWSRLWADLVGRGAGQRVAAILFGLAVLGSVVWWGWQHYSPKSVPDAPDSVLTVDKGLSDPVEILRDRRGIAHIQAADESDAWFALGFVHAQDRLAQMLWLRRLAQGRNAEVSGEVGLDSDRLVRTLGLVRLAEMEWNRLDASTRGVLEVYAQGVNFVIQSVRDHGSVRIRPRGFDEQHRVQDWRPVDSLTIAKLVAWETGNGVDTEIVLDDLIRELGGRLARLFRPIGMQEEEGTLGSIGLPPSRANPSNEVPRGEPPEIDWLAAARLWGGAAWVLAGDYTESGAPILVADYHVSPMVPSLLYEARIQGGSLDVAGVTIPGIPVFWAGRNLDLAWAAIPAGAVTVDLYRETVRESDGSYHDGDGWVKLTESSESIRVRTASGWRDDPWLVRSTRHGPLLGELSRNLLRREPPDSEEAEEPYDRVPLSLSWTGMRPGNGIASMLALLRARGVNELENALSSHHEPVLAVVYADRAGEAGVQLAGWLPRRTLPSSLVPVPGRMRIYDWRGPIPFSELPMLRLDSVAGDSGSPERSWLGVSDALLPAQGLTRAEIEWSWKPGVRQRRLERMLGEVTAGGTGQSSGSPAPQRIDLRSAASLAWDEQDVEAAEVVPALLRLAEQGPPLRPEAREIAQILSLWDGTLSAESQGAAAYSVVMQAIFDDLIRPVLGDELLDRYLALPWVRPQSLVARILVGADRDMAPGGWTDRARVMEAVHQSLRQTWVVLSHRLGPDRDQWVWGRLHRLVFKPFSPELAGAGEIDAVEIGGGNGTLASASFGVRADFEVDRAALYRMAVDLSAPDRMLTALAPGQSESVGESHYEDRLERWREGRPGLLLMSRLLVEDEAGSRLLLEPKP